MKCKEDISNYIFSGQSGSSNLLYLGSSNSIARIHVENNSTCVQTDYIDNSIQTSVSDVSNTYSYNSTGIEHRIDIPKVPIQGGVVERNINTSISIDPIRDTGVTWLSDFLFEDLDIGLLKETNPPVALPLNDESTSTRIIENDGSVVTNVLGTGFVFTFPSEVFLGSFEMLDEILIYPSVFYIYAKKDSRWIEIFSWDNEFDGVFTHNKLINIKNISFSASQYAFVIQGMRPHPEATLSTIANNRLELKSTEIDWEAAPYDRYKVQVSSLKFYYSATKFNDYTIDMRGNSILNTGSLSIEKLIFNNVVYTELVSKDDLNRLDFKLEDYTTPTIFRTLVDPTIDVTASGTSNIIPYYMGNINSFNYDKKITTRYLEQLYNLSEDRSDGILFQNSYGDLYKSFDINTQLNINNIHVSNLEIQEDIILNDESIKWDKYKNRFIHGSSNIGIQDEVFFRQIRKPIYHEDTVYISSNLIENNTILEFIYRYDNDQYILRQPHGYGVIESESLLVIYDNVKNYIRNTSYWNSMNIENKGEDVMNSDGSTKVESEDVFIFEGMDGNNVYYMDFYEYESNKEGVLKGISFSITNSYLEGLPPKSFYVLAYDKDSKWRPLLHVDNYDKMYHTDMYFPIEVEVDKYSRFRVAITDLDGINESVGSEIYQYCLINRLYFYIVEGDNRGKIVSNNDIESLRLKELQINNNTDLSSRFSKVIINPDIDYGDQTQSVLHINSRKNNGSNLLRMMVIDDETSDPKLLNSAVHSIDIFNNTTYYKIGVTNQELNTVRDIITVANNALTMNHGNFGVNVNNNEMIDDGISVRSSIRIYNEQDSGFVSIRTDVDVSDVYHIVLPSSKGSVNKFLQIYNIENNIVYTKWTDVSQEVFRDEHMYFGGSDVNSMFEIAPYSNMDFKNSNMDTIEYMTHMRKAMIGPIEKGDSNVLEDIINDYSLTVVGSIYTTVDVTTDSDIRYKTNLERLDNVRDKIEKLTGYTYNHSGGNADRRYAGLIAQDVNKVMPECVYLKHDEHLRVMYSSLSSLYVECIKDIYKEIDNIKNEINIQL